jgi:hypothetical protein
MNRIPGWMRERTEAGERPGREGTGCSFLPAMIRSLGFLLLLGTALVGCVRTGESSTGPGGEPASAPPSGVHAASPVTSPPAGPSAPAAGSGEGSKSPSANTCREDRDCSQGKVCEDCRGEKCCVTGCRSDAQCPSGKTCKQVECITAPCPAQCV